MTLAAALTVVHSILQATLSERTGLRRQVRQLSERTRDEGALLVDDIVSAPELDFLERNAELPRRFFRATWSGHWYLPEAQQIDVHGSADDRIEVWIDDRLVVQHQVLSEIHTDVQSIALGPGVHALRVEYDQYGGTGIMRAGWAPHGERARAFESRRLFPEPPDADDLFLSSSVVRLRMIMLFVWLAPIPLIGLLVWIRLPAARTDSRGASPATLPLRRRDIVLLAGLCAGMFVYGVGNLSVQGAGDDGYQNLTLGLRLVDTGEYGLDGRDAFREPFMPAVWGVMDRTRQWMGFESVRRDCLGENSPPCPSSYAPLKIVNLAFLLVGAVVAFVLVRQLGGANWLACGAFLLTSQNGQLLVSVDRFYTEPHAAALLILTAFFAFRMYHGRRPADGVWLGLTLAALVLTKVVFVYLWIFIALAFVALDALNRRVDRSTVLLVTVFLGSHFIPVVAWMARNHSTIGRFTVVEGRETSVLLAREAYHNMRDDEFAAAFWYYLPATRHRPGDGGVAAASLDRVAPFDAMRFRRSMSGDLNRPAEDILYGLLAEPMRHLRTSLLLAWRGVFLARSVAGPSPPDRDLGYSARPNAQRLAEQWELLPWPRWGIPFNAVFSTIHHLAGFLSLLVAPAWFWLVRKRSDVILIALPALYCHGVYAMATHFIPRYADPETPLRSVAVMLLVFPVASWAHGRWNRWRRLRSS